MNWSEITVFDLATNPVYNHPEFVTHSNYVHAMKEMSDNISLTITNITANNLQEPVILRKKLNLIKLTLDNIIEEKRNIDILHDYSLICVSWIPVKSYYLLFNLLIILEFFINDSPDWFDSRHIELCNKFRNQLHDGTISFNNPELNLCFTANTILSWQIPRSENLRGGSHNPEIRKQQIIKKIYEYKKEDYKRNNKIKKLGGKKLVDFKNRTQICLFDFFYWYRIKANYRDMEFIDNGVPIEEFYQFYTDYFNLTINYYQALKTLLNQLSVQKLRRSIIN